MNFTKKRPKERQRARARDGEQEAVSYGSLPTPPKKIQKKLEPHTTHHQQEGELARDIDLQRAKS